MNINEKDQLKVSAYSDADWAGDLDSRRSTTGYIVAINGCIVSWVSKKQTTIALSTTEAEYMAMSAATQEIKWVNQLLEELNLKQKEPVTLYTDNKSAKAISENDVSHDRTKHIDIRHHYVREAVKKAEIKVQWIETAEQMADIQTKAVEAKRFVKLRDMMMSEI